MFLRAGYRPLRNRVVCYGWVWRRGVFSRTLSKLVILLPSEDYAWVGLRRGISWADFCTVCSHHEVSSGHSMWARDALPQSAWPRVPRRSRKPVSSTFFSGQARS